MDADAGQALEDLGDAASLKRTLPHWELARVSARTPDERTMADASVRRVKARLAELARVAEAPPVEVAPAPRTPELQPKAEPLQPTPPPPPVMAAGRRALRPEPMAVHIEAPGRPAWRTAAAVGAGVGSLAAFGLSAAALLDARAALLDARAADQAIDDTLAKKAAEGRVVGYGTDAGAPGRARAEVDARNGKVMQGGVLARAGVLLALAGWWAWRQPTVERGVRVVPVAGGVVVVGRF